MEPEVGWGVGCVGSWPAALSPSFHQALLCTTPVPAHCIPDGWDPPFFVGKQWMVAVAQSAERPAVKTIQKTKQGAVRVVHIDYTSFDDFGFLSSEVQHFFLLLLLLHFLLHLIFLLLSFSFSLSSSTSSPTTALLWCVFWLVRVREVGLLSGQDLGPDQQIGAARRFEGRSGAAQRHHLF